MSIFSKSYTLAELAKGLDVTIQGDPFTKISGVCAIQRAEPEHITFLMHSGYKKFLQTTQASAVILSPKDAHEFTGNALISADPYFTYSQVAKYFDDQPIGEKGIHPTAIMGSDCILPSSVSIGPYCVIGHHVTLGEQVVLGAHCIIGDGSRIGDDSHLHPGVTLAHRVTLGQRVVVASGTVIGSDGFGNAKHKGRWHKIPQLGGVVIGDDVDIGANCTIDRGAIEDTVIENGVKIDNLSQIGHNVVIGEHTAIAGCVGISGSTTLGKNCLVGGGTGFAGHITIADNVAITGMTAVTKSIREPNIYSSGVGGLVTNLEWRKRSARLQRLKDVMARLKTIEAVLNIASSDHSSEEV